VRKSSNTLVNWLTLKNSFLAIYCFVIIFCILIGAYHILQKKAPVIDEISMIIRTIAIFSGILTLGLVSLFHFLPNIWGLFRLWAKTSLTKQIFYIFAKNAVYLFCIGLFSAFLIYYSLCFTYDCLKISFLLY
jgi:hypothetical protein